jgi:ABC-type multidrug transport system fused ATPase/permease subunit
MSPIGDLRTYIRIYARYLGRRMYLVFALTLATALTQGFGITLLLPFLSAVQVGDAAPAERGWAEAQLHALLTRLGIADSLLGILAFMAVVFVAKGGLAFARSAYRGHLQAQLLRELKRRLFDAYTRMAYRHYIRRNTGHFINVITGQVNRFFHAFTSFVGVVSKGLTAASYFGFALLLTWTFSLMALGLGLGLLAAFTVLNRYVRTLSRTQAREASTLNSLLVQALQAFKYIVATHQVAPLRARVLNSIRRLTGYTYRQNLAGAFTGALREPVSVLLILGIIALQVSVFQAPVAPIMVALLLFHRGLQSLLSVQGAWQQTMTQIGAVEMVAEELATVQARREDRTGRTAVPLRTGLSMEGVSFAYTDDDGDVLRDVSLTVPAHQTVALVGASGAGKSTLVDLMTLMLRPRTGTIRIDGVPHDEVDLAAWRDQLGYVAQETVVFDDTVANNIHLWQGDSENDAALRARMVDAARRAHAHDFIAALPNGYHTMVGDRGVRLSGGQKQRLFVARELFKQPTLLLLDEATSDLDTASEQHIQESIDALKGEVTVVIIAHRLSTVKNADRVYVLDDGRVVEAGTYPDLRARDNGAFRKMVERQQL